jgi:hypothetical protein
MYPGPVVSRKTFLDNLPADDARVHCQARSAAQVCCCKERWNNPPTFPIFYEERRVGRVPFYGTVGFDGLWVCGTSRRRGISGNSDISGKSEFIL